MKYTDTLKLATLELNLDGKMLGRDFLSVYSGTGENNLKKIDAFADSTNRAITQIKNSPKTIYVDAKKSTMGIYTATVPSIEDGVMDLTNNGFYVIRIDSDNETEVVTIRINDTISKQLKKIHTDGTIVDMSVGDIKKGHEYIYRYNGVYLIAINLNALTFMNRPIDDFVLKEDIVDDVLTPSTDVPLSANQGKITNEKIDKIKSDLETDISNLDTELTEKLDTTKTDLTAYIDNQTDVLFDDFNYEYAPDTGIISLSLSRKDGTNKKIDIDLPLELIIESGHYDAVNKKIVLILANADKIEIPVEDLFNEYFADELSLELYTDTEDNNKLKFRIRSGGVSKSLLGNDVIDEFNRLNSKINNQTSDIIKYIPQTLTEPQKAQGRSNIGAVSQEDINTSADNTLVNAKEYTNTEITKVMDIVGVANNALEVRLNGN